MNYNDTVHWMFAQLPMYQQQGASAYRKDLHNIQALTKHLQHPEQKIKCIHVAGTNGKGSTSHLIVSVLQEAGYRVGLYTSPHLKDFRERIKINGEMISEEYVVDFIAQHQPFFEKHSLSFFEMTVGLAFDYFAHQKVDIAVIEVGMGGRLDATNIITPLVSVITNISKDHTAFLGNTLAEIAGEKAGIIKPNIPVVIGEYTAETKPVFEAKAKECNAEIFYAQDLIQTTPATELLGEYQEFNKKTVMQTLRILQSKKLLSISENHISDGFMNVIINTGLQGRWQQLGSNPKIICDTAHNSAGLKIVMQQIEHEKFEELHMILGVVNDKDLTEILPLLPQKAHYYFCKPDLPRGLDAEILKKIATNFGLTGDVYSSVSEAYQAAQNKAAQNDFIYVGGSTFVVAEIL
ncbi:bifunctional folylpolyglutamate synthase/dihydrofolate synthase [Flavobacterium sp. CYK-55]|uniref:bifunctional folylpolyglutamate synthase/dihydrofolate synthase n=1 Tax=Flavobacterium sp. CYK-55 TaxID=2835529 RepID=UPI001BCCE3E7|nr:folylpolyglutamate synthase/dihydrofolate synthase family protein [Flavobacterium sp. CYK-55]MBS7786558.1 bifunctional folylpolyglutamate synthase/dihydrofolate synthase [Flavobacterium sp. CYK-55]